METLMPLPLTLFVYKCPLYTYNLGKIVETKITRFDGGMKNDPRDPSPNTCRVCTNFDALTNPYKLTPYPNSESGDSAPTTSRKQNFVIALRTGATFSLYALGVVSGAGTAEVLFKDLTTGASNDLDDNGWSTPANNQSASGATAFDLFIYYRKVNLIFGARAGTHIWAFNAGSAFADTHQSLTYTTIRQGLVHTEDDILYIPYFDSAAPTSAVASNNNGSWDTTALSLPKHLIPQSLCESGNYLAIGCGPDTGAVLGDSKVILWDRDSISWNEMFDAG